MIKKYIDFLRQLVDTKYMIAIDNITVLADSLLNGYYVVIFEIEQS